MRWPTVVINEEEREHLQIVLSLFLPLYWPPMFWPEGSIGIDLRETGEKEVWHRIFGGEARRLGSVEMFVSQCKGNSTMMKSVLHLSWRMPFSSQLNMAAIL